MEYHIELIKSSNPQVLIAPLAIEPFEVQLEWFHKSNGFQVRKNSTRATNTLIGNK